MKKKNLLLLLLLLPIMLLSACSTSNNATTQDIGNTFDLAEEMADNQPTPTDMEYSLERYNLIRRAYWVNGQREKAISLPCEITKPLGYIILITESGAILGRFVVDGKVSSLNSWLTPDTYYKKVYYTDNSPSYEFVEVEMPDVDGTYGTNDNGIFFFTPDGKYIEWTGNYLYSDIPFLVTDPVLGIEGV